MIIGQCPYSDCDGSIWLGCDDWPMPSVYKHKCKVCDKVIWTNISRIDPKSWTEKDFIETHKIDEETKKVSETFV